MSTTRPHEFDVAVIGGGPAGATTACRLARAGRRVILLERDRFPRFHVGESLLATVNEVLEEIGAADLVRARGFPAKWGATFGTGDGTFERFADFSAAPEVRTPQTWQVPRAEFDELLLRHAAASRSLPHPTPGRRSYTTSADTNSPPVAWESPGHRASQGKGRMPERPSRWTSRRPSAGADSHRRRAAAGVDSGPSLHNLRRASLAPRPGRGRKNARRPRQA
jgi:choline dehydrogenase-like flavoprotein